jgi:hypothetical protein
MAKAKIELPGFMLYRHEDMMTSGIPDLSATGWGKTSWYEFKHGTPDFEKNELQEAQNLRLAAAGTCFYILYCETISQKRTLIIHPKEVFGKGGKTSNMTPLVWSVGFDHRLVIEFIRKTHRVRRETTEESRNLY